MIGELSMRLPQKALGSRLGVVPGLANFGFQEIVALLAQAFLTWPSTRRCLSFT